MKTKQTITAAIFGGLLFAAGPALAHGTDSDSGTETNFSCSGAKSSAHLEITVFGFTNEITSRHVGKCEKDGDEYLVDWSVTGYDTSMHFDADHTHTGGSRGDRGGTSSYSD